jgi:hypothetical protein
MHKLRLLLVVALASASLTAGLSAHGHRPAQDADATLDKVLAKAAAYVADYRQKLTYVMATERSKQELVGGFATGGTRQEETLASDVYFVYVPADSVWMAVRDVEIVDGKVLKNRDNVMDLLNSGQAGAARELKIRNARYNLGSILRNFNEPTLSLLVLDAKHRNRFTFTRQNQRGDRMTLSFVERETPTLIIDTGGRPAYARGELTIDMATGRVEKASLRVQLNGGIDAELVTSYRPDKKLDMWVPSKFEEKYSLGGRRPEKITAESNYSDYNRFDVSVRIK